jgi:hypothetical protein
MAFISKGYHDGFYKAPQEAFILVGNVPLIPAP